MRPGRSSRRLYSNFVGRQIDFHELGFNCKQMIMRLSLASEVNVLASHLSRLAEWDRCSRDFLVALPHREPS